MDTQEMRERLDRVEAAVNKILTLTEIQCSTQQNPPSTETAEAVAETVAEAVTEAVEATATAVAEAVSESLAVASISEAVETVAEAEAEAMETEAEAEAMEAEAEAMENFLSESEVDPAVVETVEMEVPEVAQPPRQTGTLASLFLGKRRSE